jgi:hypothetical protein
MLLARLVSGRYGPPIEDRPYIPGHESDHVSWFSRLLALILRRKGWTSSD